MARIYDVRSWDPIILPKSGGNPQPGLTIHPDKPLLDLIQRAPHQSLSLRVTGTNSPYDNVLVMGFLRPVATTGGFRPNAQAETGDYILLLEFVWNGYPKSNGQVAVLDFVEHADLSAMRTTPESHSEYRESFAEMASGTSTYKYGVFLGAWCILGFVLWNAYDLPM